jgi:hypothetical protein
MVPGLGVHNPAGLPRAGPQAGNGPGKSLYPIEIKSFNGDDEPIPAQTLVRLKNRKK